MFHGGWQVHVEDEWERGTVAVWIYQRRDHEATNFLGPDLDTVTRLELWEDRPEPTMRMPLELAGPLAAALADVLPPDRAQGRHLDDAIQVRDRLLSLVESAAPSSPERGEGK